MTEQAARVIYKEIDGKGVIVDVHNGSYFTLNKTATEIWRLLKDGKTESEAIDLLTDQYAIPREEIEKDVASCLNTLRSKNLI